MTARSDAIADSRKWEAAIAFVRSYNDWQRAMKQYGALSDEANEAFIAADKAEKHYKRLSRRY